MNLAKKQLGSAFSDAGPPSNRSPQPDAAEAVDGPDKPIVCNERLKNVRTFCEELALRVLRTKGTGHFFAARSWATINRVRTDYSPRRC
jgi:hypothetical protein